MKKILLVLISTLSLAFVKAQTTYYWTGNSGDSINVLSNWNTALDGSGASRSSNTNTTDILVFDGSTLGSGFITAASTASISCGQLVFTNNAKVNMTRLSSGTTTVTIAGGTGDDFVIDAGSTLAIPASTLGSIRYAMAATNTGRVSGTLSMITSQQARIDNTTGGTPRSLVFTSGSSFITNITASSASYGFGNSAQSSEKWVVFQSGSDLYYQGGFSPNGSGTLFSAVDMQPGSTWHQQASNAIASFGNFFNRKNYGNVVVENGATLTALGPVYSIGNLTINNGCSFITASSGQTVVLGNLTVDGSLSSPASSTSTVVLGGSTTQTVSGVGTINVGGLLIGDHADVVLNSNIIVQNGASVYGKINFNTHQISGTGGFNAFSNTTAAPLTANAIAGNYFIGPVAGFTNSYLGLTVSGSGIAANTTVVSYSSALDTIYISKPVQSNATGAGFTFASQSSTLETANSNGFDPSTGSVIVAGNQTFQNGINYIIDAATIKPFGITTGSTAPHLFLGSVNLNASITTNIGFAVSGNLQLNSSKATIRTLDTVEVLSGATLTGTFNSANYFITSANNTTGAQGVLRFDGIGSSTLFPIGSPNYYMPATVSPATSSDFTAAVFEGITSDGTPNGTALSSTLKQTKVDAVWNINRVNGSGTAGLQLQWAQQLEGSTFTTLTNADIGIIVNQNPSWALPITPADNTNNIASASFTNFGAFGVGAQPPAQAFVFNPLPTKTYGDADFNGGAFSANTTQPIIYTSSNPAVATIVSNNIHIVGVGVSTITASQATDGFYPAVSASQTLTVNKANLTIKADDKTKPQGDPNPILTVTYIGFVNGETSSVLTTPVAISTTATTASPPGSYPITVSGATATNYNISLVNGTLTVTPRQNQTITFNAIATKTYGNANFAIGATSTNNTIPITYASSNPSVATIVGNNIHIVGAGTATITASQASNAFYFAATDVARTLTVNKANLTVKASDTSKIYRQPNPPFTLTYTGFVLGETISALTTAPTASTTAGTTTPPGYYPINVSGGVSNNYNFIYTAGRLTIYPATGTSQTYLQVYMSNSNTLSVKVYSPVPDLGDVFVYDITGKLVMRKNVFIAQGFLTYNLSFIVPASGIYVIHVVGRSTDLKTTVSILK
jgi:hypothetical protein